MDPVAIFRHSPTEGPGYFATFLETHSIPWRIIKIDEGEPVPDEPRRFSGLAFMGGPMSVNDDLPWIPPVLELIRKTRNADIPLLGHCLGGQLLSKALGGRVTLNPVKEIGWGEVTVPVSPVAREWFGNIGRFLCFHWHGETFSLPREAALILSSPWCENQAWAMGPHLAMQCHVEMTGEMVTTWCDAEAEYLRRHAGPTVQSAETMAENLAARVKDLNAVADRLYSRWIQGLKR